MICSSFRFVHCLLLNQEVCSLFTFEPRTFFGHLWFRSLRFLLDFRMPCYCDSGGDGDLQNNVTKLWILTLICSCIWNVDYSFVRFDSWPLLITKRSGWSLSFSTFDLETWHFKGKIQNQLTLRFNPNVNPESRHKFNSLTFGLNFNAESRHRFNSLTFSLNFNPEPRPGFNSQDFSLDFKPKSRSEF